MAEIGLKLKHLRNSAKMTQSDLANATELHRNSIYFIETGVAQNVPNGVVKMAEYFGCEVTLKPLNSWTCQTNVTKKDGSVITLFEFDNGYSVEVNQKTNTVYRILGEKSEGFPLHGEKINLSEFEQFMNFLEQTNKL
jgi:DNA-binding XRE family transcriptional regulator